MEYQGFLVSVQQENVEPDYTLKGTLDVCESQRGAETD